MQTVIGKVHQFPTIKTARTCARCGREFSATAREYSCADCKKPKAEPVVGGELTPRERQVVDLIKHGHANKEIAYRLHLTEGTIKEYLHSIFRKLGVSNRTELAVWAMMNLAA